MARADVDLVIVNASEVLTLSGESVPRTGEHLQNLGIVERGGVAVTDGKIVRVGPSREIEKLGAKRTIDAEGRVVLPGFVDAHTHVVFTGSRENELGMKLDGMTYTQIASQGGGILSTVEATRKATKAQLKDETSSRLESMLSHGTTTLEAKSGYGLETKTELRILQAIAELSDEQPVELVPTFLGAHAVPPEFDGRSDDYATQIVDEAIPAVASAKLARFCDVFVDQGAFTIQQGRRILKAAKSAGLGAKVHADELTRNGGAELACEVGALSADHLLQTNEKSLRGLARDGVVAVLLPTTPFSTFLKPADASLWVKCGVPVALGSDLSPNSWNESMQFAIQLAVYQSRLFLSEAISAATINAAHAIGAADRVGSLEVGKEADLVILDAPSYEWLAYRLGVNLVQTVVKGGEVVVDDGALSR